MSDRASHLNLQFGQSSRGEIVFSERDEGVRQPIVWQRTFSGI